MSKTETLRAYIEEVTLVLEQTGLPRTASRILAWLLVCHPPEQTMNDLMDALQMSKSSVSAATQSLIQFKLIERVSLPRKRRDYYRIQRGVWTRLLAARVAEISRLREVADKGLGFIENTDTTSIQRLREMHEYVTFLEEEWQQLVEHWEERQRQIQSSAQIANSSGES